MDVVLTPQVFVGKFSVEKVNRVRFHVEQEFYFPDYFRVDVIVFRKISLQPMISWWLAT